MYPGGAPVTEPILTLSIDQMGVQALANLLRTIAEDYPLGIVEGTTGGLEIYPHGVGSRRAPFDLEEPPEAAPVLPGAAAPYHRCAVDGCGKSFPTRYGVEVHIRRMHKPAPATAEPAARTAVAVEEPAPSPATLTDTRPEWALPVSSYCRRGECLSCKSAQARCGHDCHPNSRQLPPGGES
jgi:hypothetical protein